MLSCRAIQRAGYQRLLAPGTRGCCDKHPAMEQCFDMSAARTIHNSPRAPAALQYWSHPHDAID